MSTVTKNCYRAFTTLIYLSFQDFFCMAQRGSLGSTGRTAGEFFSFTSAIPAFISSRSLPFASQAVSASRSRFLCRPLSLSLSAASPAPGASGVRFHTIE